MSAATASSKHDLETPSQRSGNRFLWLLAMLVPLAVGLGTKAPELLLPIGPDQGTYSYVAERILDGVAPYTGAYDNKPLLTYYVHAAVISVVPESNRWTQSCLDGVFQPCAYVALQLFDVLWMAATIISFFPLARRLGGSPWVALAATTLLAFHMNVSQLSKEGNTPEKELLLPMVLAYLTLLYWRDSDRKAWLVLSGALAGTAFLFKQTAITVPAVILVWAFWEGWLYRRSTGQWAVPLPRDRVLNVAGVARAAGIFLIGLLLPVAVAVGWLASIGSLGAFWDASFAYNVSQAESSIAELPRAFLRGSWQVFAGSSAVLWILALGGGLRVLSGSGSAPARLAVVWAVADFASLFLGGTKFAQVHFVQLVPSFSLLGGIALAEAWVMLRPMRWGRAYLVVIVLAVLALASQFQTSVMLRAYNERLPPRASVPPEQIVAFQLRANRLFAVERTLFVWGDASQLYLLARGHSPSRFFHGFPLSRVFTKGDGYLIRRSELLTSFTHNQPAAIVIDPATAVYDPDGSQGFNLSGFSDLGNLLGASYTEAPPPPGARNWRIFFRKPL